MFPDRAALIPGADVQQGGVSRSSSNNEIEFAVRTETLPVCRLEGTVQKVDRGNAIILVAYDKVTREVRYDQSTRFTLLDQPGTLAAVK